MKKEKGKTIQGEKRREEKRGVGGWVGGQRVFILTLNFEQKLRERLPSVHYPQPLWGQITKQPKSPPNVE